MRYVVVLWLAFAAPRLPGEILDLSHWKLTVPQARPGSDHANELEGAALATFREADCFDVDADGKGVVFRAVCGGATTKGSKYPRCELRELDQAGQLANWSTDAAERHRLTVRLAITAVPAVKKHVVCAQIHDADNDLLMVRLEGTKLFVERTGAEDVMLDRNYRLGTPFDLRIDAGGGTVDVWYNGEQRLTWPVSRRGCYFKAGCYTQSNPTRGDAADAYGEVVIYELQVQEGR